MTDALLTTTTLRYRPVGRYEYELVRDSGFHAFPPRLSHQPIYPVLDFDYAAQIARDWNTGDAASGFQGTFCAYACARTSSTDTRSTRSEIDFIGNIGSRRMNFRNSI